MVEVHPNYYGVAGDLSGLARVCQERGCRCWWMRLTALTSSLIRRLPGSALEAGSGRGGAELAQDSDLLDPDGGAAPAGLPIDRERLRRCLSILQTTSPSYLLMLSLDIARWQMEN